MLTLPTVGGAVDRWLRRYRSRPDGMLVALALATPAVVAGIVATLTPGRGLLLVVAVAAGYVVGLLARHLSRRSARMSAFVPPSNLPPPPTYIAGRGSEVSAIEAFLRGAS